MIPDPETMGADLYRFKKPNRAVVAADVNGGGNSANYGFRTMVNESKSMWLGTANPFNLDPEGGWEMLRYKPGRAAADSSAAQDEVARSLSAFLQSFLADSGDASLTECVIDRVEADHGAGIAGQVAELAGASLRSAQSEAKMLPIALALQAAGSCQSARP